MQNHNEDYQLSPQQRNVWQQQHGRDSLFRSHCALRLCGALDAAALHDALLLLVNRHQILRTCFRRTPGIKWPLQSIPATGSLCWHVSEAAGATAADMQDVLAQLLAAQAATTINIETGPTLHARLAQVSESEYVLLLTLPTLCADARTLRNLVAELSDAYASIVRAQREAGSGAEAEVEEEITQYIQFAEWQNQLQEEAEAGAGRAYWREQRESAGKVVGRLACERVERLNAAGSEPESEWGSIGIEVRGEACEQLREIGKGAGGKGEEEALLASWVVLMGRWSGDEEVVVGRVEEGRKYEELERGLGLYAKVLPVRCRLQGHERLSDVVEQVVEQARQNNKWLEYFSWEESNGTNGNHNGANGKHDGSNGSNGNHAVASSSFSFGFEYEQWPAPVSAAGVNFSVCEQRASVGRFKVQLSVARRADSLFAQFYYDETIYSINDIKRLAGQFEKLLSSVADKPEALLNELDIIGEDERRQLLIEWNATAEEFQSEQCLHEMFERQAAETPDAVALVFGAREISYAELNARANQLARYLVALGTAPDALVGIYMERSPEMLVGLLGVLKAGGAYMPLDASNPPERLAFMLEDAGVKVLLSEQGLAESLPATDARVIRLDAEWELIARESEENFASGATEGNLAYVIYTSGSTGTPKGVLVEHRGLVNYLNWCTREYRVAEGFGSPVHSPLGFDLTVTSLLSPLVVGERAVLLPEDKGIETLAAALRAQADFSLVKITPTHLELLGQSLPETAAGGARALVIGGEALHAETLAFWRQHAPQTRLINEYGPTETVVGCCTYEVDAEHAGTGIVPIGRPISNTQMYVLDEQFRLLPAGVEGELCIGGAGLARGYLNRPELTAERFIPHPFSTTPGARLYRTGDTGRYRSDGQLEYVGRADAQVKIRGFRIELGEVEAVLREHSGVAEAVVIAREDESNREKRMLAYVVSKAKAELTVGELRSHLREKLPEYMMPMGFVMLEEMPLTVNGKIDRKALPAPEQERLNSERVFIGARSPVEEALLEIWRQMLGYKQISVHDNFFELGGHSLVATLLLSRIRDTFHVELTVRTLFEWPTVAGLGAILEEALRVESGIVVPPMEPVARDGELPLSFAQQRLWFVDRLAPDNVAYNVPAAVPLGGALNIPALEQTLSEVVKRHEALRTTFSTVDGRPIQVINEPQPIKLPLSDLTLVELTDEERAAEVKRIALEEVRQPFDLARGPLLRLRLVRLGAEDYVLLYIMHHIISDGWSKGVLVNEVLELYNAILTGREPNLPELPIQYADFAHWQRQWMQGEVLETHLGFWKRQLEGAPHILELPTDRPRPPVQTFKGASQPVVLEERMTSALKELSQQQGVTLFMTLLAAFQTLLQRYSGQDDVLVGTPIAGRNRAEVENLIGFFVNTIVMRANFSDNPSFIQLLGQVREMSLGAYAHQDVPFEQVVEELRPERALSHTPLFQVIFGLSHFVPSSRPAPEHAVKGATELTGRNSKFVDPGIEVVPFDMAFTMAESGTHISGTLKYNTDLFDESTIARMIESFYILLEGIIANPEERVARLPLLKAAEQQAMLEAQHAATADFPRESCIHEMFEQQVERTPDAIALVFEDEELTYRELNRRANQVANHLRALGIGTESKVGICMERSVEMIVAMLGTLKAGGAYVPLDPTYPAERIAFMREDSQLPVLLTQQRLVDKLSEPASKIVCLDTDWQAIAGESTENVESGVGADNLAYVIYTSGSTGLPKGTMLQHRGVVNLALAEIKAFSLSAESRVLQYSSLSFDASVWEIFATFLSGARLCLARHDSLLPGAGLSQLISRHGVTTLTMPPSVLATLNPYEVEGLRTVITAGEACPAELARKWATTTGGVLQLVNAYGPTETTVCATMAEIPADVEGVPSIGRALPNMEVYVLDRHWQLVPAGVEGEIFIGGTGLARGYLNRPELTAERFIPHPFSTTPGARLYRTGDTGRYRSDGQLEYVGRADAQVKIRGFRIELGEVEAVLREHSGVAEAVVIAREDEGGREKRMIAYVVSNGAAEELTVGELRSHLREKLPEYMMPTGFVLLAEMPLTPNGKIDRKALPAPDMLNTNSNVDRIPPRTEAERTIVTLWEEVLEMQNIGIQDNFFEIGGHSLLLARLQSRLNETFKSEISILNLFEYPTVETQATFLTPEESEPSAPIGDEMMERLRAGRHRQQERLAQRREFQ